ncbi:hypothetical protein ES319_D08G224300v1, partial [Gossypium barbadense]
VYANGDDAKKFLSEKYGNLSAFELKNSKDFNNDLMEADISMTVRLQIVYSKLSIKSIRSAYEESVGSRLQKFSGSDNKELLQRFTSQFKDEYKLPRGSLVELSKEPGYVVKTISKLFFACFIFKLDIRSYLFPIFLHSLEINSSGICIKCPFFLLFFLTQCLRISISSFLLK